MQFGKNDKNTFPIQIKDVSGWPERLHPNSKVDRTQLKSILEQQHRLFLGKNKGIMSTWLDLTWNLDLLIAAMARIVLQKVIPDKNDQVCKSQSFLFYLL